MEIGIDILLEEIEEELQENVELLLETDAKRVYVFPKDYLDKFTHDSISDRKIVRKFCLHLARSEGMRDPLVAPISEKATSFEVTIKNK